MNGDGMADDAALQELRDLISSGGSRPLPGPPDAVIVIRLWPDASVDTLAVTSPTQALAERTNQTGHPVWRYAGRLTEVIARLRALPAPDAPDAPRQVIGGGGADRAVWTP